MCVSDGTDGCMHAKKEETGDHEITKIPDPEIRKSRYLKFALQQICLQPCCPALLHRPETSREMFLRHAMGRWDGPTGSDGAIRCKVDTDGWMLAHKEGRRAKPGISRIPKSEDLKIHEISNLFCPNCVCNHVAPRCSPARKCFRNCKRS